MSEKHDDNWIKNQIDSAVADHEVMEKKTGRNIRSRKRVASFTRFLVLLVAAVCIAEHFYRDEFKAFFKEHDIPVYEFCASVADGSWFDKEKTPFGKGDSSPSGQIKYAKDKLNKRTVTANEIINEK